MSYKGIAIGIIAFVAVIWLIGFNQHKEGIKMQQLNPTQKAFAEKIQNLQPGDFIEIKNPAVFNPCYRRFVSREGYTVYLQINPNFDPSSKWFVSDLASATEDIIEKDDPDWCIVAQQLLSQ